MKIVTKLKVGQTAYELEVDEKDEREALHKAIVLGNPPSFCGKCKNTENFRLDSNKDKDGNTYINVICRNCGAKAKLGYYKAGGFFWHKFEKYVPQQQPGGQPATVQAPQPDPQEPTEDVPF